MCLIIDYVPLLLPHIKCVMSGHFTCGGSVGLKCCKCAAQPAAQPSAAQHFSSQLYWLFQPNFYKRRLYIHFTIYYLFWRNRKIQGDLKQSAGSVMKTIDSGVEECTPYRVRQLGTKHNTTSGRVGQSYYEDLCSVFSNCQNTLFRVLADMQAMFYNVWHWDACLQYLHQGILVSKDP